MADKSAQDGTVGDVSESESQGSVHVVLAGCSKAGQSTLAANLLGLKEKQDISAQPITMEHNTRVVTRNGVTLRVTDTIGLMEQGRSKVLKELSKHTQRDADLLVYCLSVAPNSNFAPGNPATMRSLQEAYGKGIWDHCTVALTFSNEVTKRLYGSREEVNTKYRAHLLRYVALFCKELVGLGIKNKKVKLFPGYQQAPECKYAISAGTDEGSTEIDYLADMEAIPTGDKPNDNVVLPIIDPVEKVTKNWVECLYTEMVRKCSNPDHKRKLLHYRYGTVKVIGSGTVAGGGVGAVLGAIGGTLGMGVGFAMGGITGGLVGGMGGLALGGVVLKKQEAIDDILESFNEQNEVD